jgi:hypothetical protein
MLSPQIRNPKLEIRNKSECQNPKVGIIALAVFMVSSIEFVSDFDIRISAVRR